MSEQVIALRGRFLESSGDPHLPLRDALLDGHLLPAPPFPPESLDAPVSITDVVTMLRRQLDRHGLGLVALDRPLESPDLIALGEQLGVLMPETDAAVQENVESERILHLISSEADTNSALRQPFGTGPLSLHSEGSGRPAPEQPRFIVLMCMDPGDGHGQTVLIPFAAVDARLSAADREVLGGLRYDRPDVPTVRRVEAGRPVYSFRDFQNDTLSWVGETGSFEAREAHGALLALLQAMYAEDGACAIRWRTGMIAVIDNTWWFHGRTAAPTSGVARRRHLKRIRILAGTGEG